MSQYAAPKAGTRRVFRGRGPLVSHIQDNRTAQERADIIRRINRIQTTIEHYIIQYEGYGTTAQVAVVISLQRRLAMLRRQLARLPRRI